MAFTITQIMEQAFEYKIGIVLLFIDFRQAFDAERRPKRMKNLGKMAIQRTLSRLVNMKICSSVINIKTQNGENEDHKQRARQKHNC